MENAEFNLTAKETVSITMRSFIKRDWGKLGLVTVKSWKWHIKIIFVKIFVELKLIKIAGLNLNLFNKNSGAFVFENLKT